MHKLLLCTDMDRTLLPNGTHEASPGSLDYFSVFVHHEKVRLVYVTGRHLSLVTQAIDDYDLPTPDYVISDVGTKIYQRNDEGWVALKAWTEHIKKDWRGTTHDDLKKTFDDLKSLTLQADDKQSTFKLSYEVDLDVDVDSLLVCMNKRLGDQGVEASLVWSIDEQEGIGLLDVLPRNATKFHAIEFLYETIGYELGEVLFCGDSGNDLAVMSSPIPSVLVANASDEIKALAESQACSAGNRQALYLARGDYLGMNGCYSAGILEGVWHFMPSMRCALQTIKEAANEG